MHTYTHNSHTNIHTHTCTRTHTHTHTHAHTRVHTHEYTHSYIYHHSITYIHRLYGKTLKEKKFMVVRIIHDGMEIGLCISLMHT